MNVGWVDCLVQLRTIPQGERSRFKTTLVNNHVSAVVSAGYAPTRDHEPALLANETDSIKIYHAWGFHPEVRALWDHDAYRKMVQTLRPSFIGEVGLDKRFLETVDWETQESRAMRAIELAREFRLPLLWHSVHATERSLKLIREAARVGVKGLWHGFHGSREVASTLIGLGWKLGVGPSLLREKNERLRGLMKSLPLESILLESDWPQPHGPYSLKMVGQALATLRDLKVEDLQAALWNNFFDLVDRASVNRLP